jgi:hypothetical protein
MLPKKPDGRRQEHLNAWTRGRNLYPKISEFTVQPNCGFAVRSMRFLRSIESSEIVALLLEGYLSHVPAALRLRHSFEPRSVVLTHLAITDVLRPAAYPEIDPTIVEWVAVDVIGYPRITLLQTRQEPSQQQTRRPPRAVFALLTRTVLNVIFFLSRVLDRLPRQVLDLILWGR